VGRGSHDAFEGSGVGCALTRLVLRVEGALFDVVADLKVQLYFKEGPALRTETTSRGDLGGSLTRDLGIIATLLEFWVKQFGDNGEDPRCWSELSSPGEPVCRSTASTNA
jgi:hypothetical protein